MHGAWHAARRHAGLLVITVWFVALWALSLSGVGRGGLELIAAVGFVLVCGAARKASSAGRLLLNGAVGGVVGLALVILVAVGRALVTGNAGAEGESPWSLLVESPLWVVILSPIGAMIGILGAAIRFLVDAVRGDRGGAGRGGGAAG